MKTKRDKVAAPLGVGATAALHRHNLLPVEGDGGGVGRLLAAGLTAGHGSRQVEPYLKGVLHRLNINDG